MPKSKLMKSSMFRKIHSHILPFFVAFSIVIIIANLLTGCGTSPGNTDSGTADNNESNIIGSAGGTVTSSDGKVKIVIPSGALNKDTEITFSAASNQPAGNIGIAYEVNPDGTTFNKPVTISIIYDEASLPSGVSESDIKLGTVTNNQWEAIIDSSVNTASNTISGSITHLSTYGIMAVNIGSVPSAPTGIAAIAGDGKVTISWDAVSGATSYNIYWSTTSGVTKTTGTKIAGATTPYPHAGRTNGITYYYVVTAVNSYGESGVSVEVSAKPKNSVITDITAPANTTISNFINSGAVIINSANVTLPISATDNLGVTGYCAQEISATPTINDACWKSITSTTSYSASLTITVGTGDGLKTVYVWFKDAAGNVSASVSNDLIVDTAASTVPGGLTATAISDTQINLTWTASTDNNAVARYNIYREGIYVGTATTTSYSDKGLTAATNYSYTVSATDAAGNESSQSSSVNTITRGTILNGELINTNNMWILSDSPYILRGNTLINSGSTLTIEPGVTVKFDGQYKLVVGGELIARGKTDQPIYFTSNKSTPIGGDWGGIIFSNSSIDASYDVNGNYVDGSIIQYATIEYAGDHQDFDLGGSIRINASSPYIDHNNIRKNVYNHHNEDGGGISINDGGNPRITNNIISDNQSVTGGGINITTADGIIENNYIVNNSASKGGGIYIWGNSNAMITMNTIINNSANEGGGIYIKLGG